MPFRLASVGPGDPGSPDGDGQYRMRDERPPSLSLSPPRVATSSPAPSHADASDSKAPSFVSEPSGTSTDQADTDSLVDASPAEVEARALEFLHDDTAPHPLSSLLHSSASTAEAEARLAALGPPIGPKDLPRKIPKSREQQEEQQGYAVAFLRKCVDEVDDSDWMFKTPPVFGAPEALDARGGDAMQNDNGDGTTWLDTAFNMESFYDEEREESVEFEEEHSGGLQFMDLGAEASSFSHTHTGTPFLLPEEEEAAGAGFSLGGRGRTGGLARGVSAMAMD